MARLQVVNFSYILLLTFGLCPAGGAAESVSLAINEIPEILEESKPKGEYTAVVLRLKKMSNFELKPSFFPLSRAGKMFSENKVDCIFPSSSKVFNSDWETIESLPLNTAYAYLIGLEHFDMHQLLANPKPRYRIAYRRGNTFGGTLTRLASHSLVELNNDIQSFGLLKGGRVDYILTYLPDSLELLQSEPVGTFHYLHQDPFYSQNDSIVCHNRPKLARFIDDLNTHITQLRETGELTNLLGKTFFKP